MLVEEEVSWRRVLPWDWRVRFIMKLRERVFVVVERPTIAWSDRSEAVQW